MDTDIHDIKNKIAELRELIRSTLDRSLHPAMRVQLMAEIVRLRTLNGTLE
jgi:hypothetical protein